MLIEKVELTLSHVGLGSLSEYATMVLFANAFSHCITKGTGISARDITDHSGVKLYPAYYTTWLKVPPCYPLSSFRLWDEVCVGVNVEKFGGAILQSKAILGRPGAIAADPSSWDLLSCPSLLATNTFVPDVPEVSRQVSVPRRPAVAALPSLTTFPSSLKRFREVRSGERYPSGYKPTMLSASPIQYSLVPVLDIPLEDDRVFETHCVLFAKFLQMMDVAERCFLTERLDPPFSIRLVESQRILERETYYLKPCRPDSKVHVKISGHLEEPTLADLKRDSCVPMGVCVLCLELFDQVTNEVLVVSRSRKLLAIKLGDSSLAMEASQLTSFYGVQQLGGINVDTGGLSRTCLTAMRN